MMKRITSIKTYAARAAGTLQAGEDDKRRTKQAQSDARIGYALQGGVRPKVKTAHLRPLCLNIYQKGGGIVR